MQLRTKGSVLSHLIVDILKDYSPQIEFSFSSLKAYEDRISPPLKKSWLYFGIASNRLLCDCVLHLLSVLLNRHQ